MANLASVSSSNLSAVVGLIDQLPPDTPTQLDPANATHRAAIEAALAVGNRSAQRYPGLYAALNRKGAAAAAGSLALVDKGSDRSGRATAMSWYAAAPQAVYAGGALFALDRDSGGLLGLGHNSNVVEGFVPVSTDTATAKRAGKGLKLLALNHAVLPTGEASFTALASSAPTDNPQDASISVSEPTQTPKTPPNVVIALGRDSVHPNNDADYTYTEPYNMNTPYLIIPFVGVAELAYSINGTVGQPIPNAVYTTQIYFVQNSGTINIPLNPTYTPQSRVNNGVTMLSDSVLQWGYPADGNSYQTTASLVYNQQSLVNEQISYFIYTFQIPLKNAPVQTFSFAVCSTNTPNEPSYQCFKVPNIKFWWHCLADTTKVKLADGSELDLSALDNKRRVKNGTGGDIAVEATSRGAHKARKGAVGADAVYRLVTDAGNELIGTGSHPIMTPDGLKRLSDLSPGSAVSTERGAARVASCESIDWDGLLCNLKLGDESDRTAGLKADAVCTYVANGIVVGDHEAMIRLQRQLTRNVEHMRSRIPSGLTTDYASAVEDIRY